jgi:hypothetical protein
MGVGYPWTTAKVQSEMDYPLPSSACHVQNIGRMVEDME